MCRSRSVVYPVRASAIRQYPPPCPWFCIRSPIRPHNKEGDIDPDELTLATSPFLYSIDVPYATFNTTGHINRNEEAVWQMVAGIASNLRLVRLHGIRLGNSLELRRAMQQPLPLWEGILRASNEESLPVARLGRLSKLTFGSAGILIANKLAQLGECTRFSELCTLELKSRILPEVLHTLAQMADGNMLANLRDISLSVTSYDDEDQRYLDELAVRMVTALQPLGTLSKRDIFSQAFTALLQTHSVALRRLEFLPTRHPDAELPFYSLSVDHVQKLSSQCPSITDLRLLIPRTKGDAHEVQIYLSNGSRSLQRLQIDIANVQSSGTRPKTFNVLNVLRWIGRSWICIRNPGDVDNTVAQEPEKAERMEAGEYLPKDQDEKSAW
ncbi:hypothetical protein K458DRAFT_381540 [Lentithecium fluviatile CBS 122367]|uniref:Uncharacterized protein n=1 Tax=Lentithecium fluviatile CBS 122367 TaxID=1168545 RepID=A0A6G1JM97_9PLEO|nr:hypothetical protein K458DRAFT_381540 [Lentithecium fluviatile CBS 122367]